LNQQWFVITESNSIGLNNNIVALLATCKSGGIKRQNGENYIHRKRDYEECKD